MEHQQLKMLLRAWQDGVDCRDQIHDLLIEMGYPFTAFSHFSRNRTYENILRQEMCKNPMNCRLIFHYMSGKVRLDQINEDDKEHLNRKVNAHN